MTHRTPKTIESPHETVPESHGGTADESEPHEKPPTRGPSARRGEVRGRILTAAREEFLGLGYDATTMSHIAQKAHCTPAMVTYYFESKQRLFRACFNLPLDPAAEILSVLVAGREGAGERVVQRALRLYEEELTADSMYALMQSLISDATTSQRFREYIRLEVIEKVGRGLGISSEFAEEIEFAMATMYGVITMRYVVKLEPLASMPRERLVRELAPVVQYRIDRAFARRELRRSHEERRTVSWTPPSGAPRDSTP